MKRSTLIWPFVLVGCVMAPRPSTTDEIPAADEQFLIVTATAYHSDSAETNDEPTLAAWGDALAPGMKAIAVSRDLIPLGLDYRALVSIEGLPGTYLVLDKMHARWKKRIDIYMGDDLAAARAWGKRKVKIRW